MVNLNQLDLSFNLIGSESITSSFYLPSLAGLSMCGNLLTTFSQHIALISTLTCLDLRFNQISFLPEEMKQLSNLKIMRLNSNKFQKISDVFSHLVNLEDLDLSYNELEALENNFNLINLTSIDLHSNKINLIDPIIGKMLKLRDIYLSCNCLTNIPSSFGKLSSLKNLILNQNKLTTIDSSIFETLGQLISLNLSYNDLEDIPNTLFNLTSLGRLDFSGNLIKKFPETLNLSNLKNLWILDLADNAFEEFPTQILTISSLTSLNIFSNNIKSIPSNIIELQRLSSFNFGYNKIFDLPEEFKNLSSLTYLRFEGNLFEKLPSCIFQITSLKTLSISSNRKIISIPSEIKNLNLSSFFASCNQISSIDDHFCEQVSLTELDLSHNKINSLPNSWGNLASLTDIDLSGNLLSKLPDSFQNLRSISQLKISFNYNLNYNDYISFKQKNNLSYFVSFSSTKKASLFYLKKEYSYKKNTQKIVVDSNQVNNSLNYINHNKSQQLGWSEMRGLRPSMEDTILLMDNFYQISELTLVGLFDGHGGNETCFLNVQKLPSVLFYNLKYILNLHGLKLDYKSILELSIENLAVLIRATFMSLHGLVKKYNLNDGSAATIALICHKYGDIPTKISDDFISENLNKISGTEVYLHDPIYWAIKAQASKDLLKDFKIEKNEKNEKKSFIILGNCGDQRVVFCRNKKAIPITVDHKPELPSEIERIRRSGGFISETRRVDGILALSRAIGDIVAQPHVTFEPDIHYIEFTADDEFIIIACDGVWDVMSSEQAVHIALSESTPSRAASRIREYAYSLGSSDNISVIIYQLKDRIKGHCSNFAMLHPKSSDYEKEINESSNNNPNDDKSSNTPQNNNSLEIIVSIEDDD